MSPVHCQTDGQHLLSFFVVGKDENYAKNKRRINIFYCNYCMDDGLFHDLIQHSACNRKFYKHNISYRLKRYVDRIYNHRTARIFCIRSSGKNVRIQSCAAGRSPYLYNFCDPDLYRNMAGCLCKYYRCISRTLFYRKFHTGLSYCILQKFYYGTATAAYYRRTARPTDIPKIIYPPSKRN